MTAGQIILFVLLALLSVGCFGWAAWAWMKGDLEEERERQAAWKERREADERAGEFNRWAERYHSNDLD